MNNPPWQKYWVHMTAKRISDSFRRDSGRYYNGSKSLHFPVCVVLQGDEYTVANALNIDEYAT